MKNITIENCSQCGLELFEWKEGERVNNYEDMKGTIPHTQLRCEIHQIVLLAMSKQLKEIQNDVWKIKERINL